MRVVSELDLTAPIAKVLFDPQRNRLLALISGTWEIVVLTWDPTYAMKVESKFNHHEHCSTRADLDFCAVDAAFHPSLNVIAVTKGNFVDLISLETLQSISVLRPFRRSSSVCFSPTGSKVLCGNWIRPNQAHKPTYNANLSTVIADWNSHKTTSFFLNTACLSFSPAATMSLGIQGEQGGSYTRILVWQKEDLSIFKKRITHNENTMSAAFSPDCKVIATIGGNSRVAVDIWDFPTLNRITRKSWKTPYDARAIPYYFARQIKFLDTNSLVFISPKGKLFEMDFLGGEITQTLEAHAGRSGTLDFRSDVGLIATGSENGVIRLWSVDKPTWPPSAGVERRQLDLFSQLYPEQKPAQPV